MAYVHIDDNLVPYLDIMIDCIKLNGEDIAEQVKRVTADMNLMGNCLEDNFLNFKYYSKEVRDKYEEAVNAEIEKSEQVWLRCEDLIAKSRPTCTKITKDLDELLEVINKIHRSLDALAIYKIEELIKVIEKFNQMPEQEKQLFAKLLEVTHEKDA